MISNYYCEGTPSLLGIFDFSFAPELLFYSFIPTIILSVGLCLMILYKDNFSVQSRALLLLVLAFCGWSFLEIILWITVPVNLNLMGWQLIALPQVLIPISGAYFALAYNKNSKRLHPLAELVLFLPIIIVAILLPTKVNISSFNLYACEGVVGPLIDYIHYFSVLTALAISSLAIFSLFNKMNTDDTRHDNRSKSLVLFSTGIFLIIYSAGVYVGEETKTYVLGLIGPIGMLVLLITLTYIIIRFRAFNIKLAATQALIIAIITLVGSQIFFVESTTNTILVIITFVFTIIGGYFLVRSVKKEIRQREELQVLTGQLAKANDRLKELDKLKSEFVSIASHQMRSPLTSMRGYASMLLEGSYGNIPEKAKEAVQRIADSSGFMAKMVENYLNVSRIESGNMKYELSDFNLKVETEKVVDDKRQEAIKQGLLLMFKSNISGQGIVNADIGKTLEIVHNLLNNALKYTLKGTIDVTVYDDQKKKKIYVDIHDSGIGMSSEDVAKLFGKFERAQNANTVNITGTGLGLYVARTMALAMKGEITAMSDGQGKGSTFRFELPLMM